MAGNSALLKAEPTLAWLGQFEPEDQPVAVALLRAMMLVSRDAFAERMRELLLRRIADGKGPVGVYVEREVRMYRKRPCLLFKEPRRKIRRAEGVGPQPVDSVKPYNKRDVGSEGIVAQLVSEVCREQKKQAFNHPGPDDIRNNKIRRFILVTDFIGSGDHVIKYLQAAWRVRSVRSWWSARATKGISFEILAYAATPQGRRVVERHHSRPEVHILMGCPTLDTAFSGSEARTLCSKYSPVKPKKDMEAIGYKNGGALIAFAHGITNNAPLILHKYSNNGKSGHWIPLFPKRVTSETCKNFSVDSEVNRIRAHLNAMRQSRLLKVGHFVKYKSDGRKILLVLAALSRAPREEEVVSRKTGLTVLEVEKALTTAFKNGWIDGRHRLTDHGHAQLKHARKGDVVESLPVEAPSFYYPKSLRAPQGASS